VDVLCGGCGKTLTVDDRVTGDLPCPHCGRLIRISAMEEAPPDDPDRILAPLEEEDDLADDFLTKAKLALKKKLLVVCGACQERLTVEQRLSGKVARCPACGQQIRVPAVVDEAPMEAKELMADVEDASPETLDVGGSPDSTADGAAPPHAHGPQAASAPTATAMRVRRRRPARRVSPAPVGALVAVLAVLTGLGGLLLGYLVWGRSADGPPEGPSPPVAGVRPERPGPRPDPRFFPPAPELFPPTRPEPVPVLRTEPGAPGADTEVKVIRAALSALAGKALVPAPAGQAFLTAAVRITAGSEPVEIDTGAGAVTLTAGEREIPALGAPPEGDFAIGARRRRMTVPPTASRIELFMFLVPRDLAGGTVRVAGVGEAELPALAPASRPRKADLPGSYAEAGRFLRLSSANPVLERVRAAPRHKLLVTAEANHFAVAVTGTPIRGQATPAGDGSFKALLTDGSSAVAGRLRLLPGGRQLVLYLGDGPYQQVVYEKQ